MNAIEDLKAQSARNVAAAKRFVSIVDEIDKCAVGMSGLGVAFEVESGGAGVFRITLDINKDIGRGAPQVGFEVPGAVENACLAIESAPEKPEKSESQAEEPIADPALLRTEATRGAVQSGLPVDGSQAATSEKKDVTAGRDPHPKSCSVPKAKAKVPKEEGGEYRTGKYSEEEAFLIHKMLDEGKSNSQIAVELGRKPSAVSVAMARFRRGRGDSKPSGAARPKGVAASPAKIKTSQMIKQKVAATERRKAKVKDAVPEQAAPVPRPIPDGPMSDSSMSDERPFAERAIAAHLNALGYRDRWDAQRDFALVEDLCNGQMLAVVADGLGLEKSMAAARWKELNTKVGDFAHQGRLLAVLKARANA